MSDTNEPQNKEELDKAVKRVVKDFGDTLHMLGKDDGGTNEQEIDETSINPSELLPKGKGVIAISILLYFGNWWSLFLLMAFNAPRRG